VSGADATEGSFAPGLPTPVTAVSLGGQVVVPDPATTVPPPLTVPGSEPSGSSGPGGVAVGTLPGGEPVTTIPGANPPATTRPAGTPGTTGSGTTAPTTTAAPPTTQPPTTTAPPPPPPFTYDQPRPANGVFTNGQGSAGCSAPVPPERTGQFVLSTPTPGKLLIERAGAAGGASGPVDPSGLFHATSPAGEVYDGQASDAGANASYLQDDGAGCTVTYNVVFTFT
jgi:hypothetical protein